MEKRKGSRRREEKGKERKGLTMGNEEKVWRGKGKGRKGNYRSSKGKEKKRGEKKEREAVKERIV